MCASCYKLAGGGNRRAAKTLARSPVRPRSLRPGSQYPEVPSRIRLREDRVEASPDGYLKASRLGSTHESKKFEIEGNSEASKLSAGSAP